jgi:putative transposase
VAPGGNRVHGLLAWEIEAILAVAEQWGPTDGSHRKLAHRACYIDRAWVSPSSVRRVLTAHGLVLPQRPHREPAVRSAWPDWLVWEPNHRWIYDATHFTRCRRVVFAIVDLVSRKWIESLVSTEETSTQVQVVFEQALIAEGLDAPLVPQRLGLHEDDPERPVS